MTHSLSTLKAWFGPVEGAIAKHLNGQELLRVVLTAILAGASVQGVLSAVVGDVTRIFSPGDVSLAVAILTLGAEICRRLGHGAPIVARP